MHELVYVQIFVWNKYSSLTRALHICIWLYIFIISSFQEWAYTMARRPLSVCLSINVCANRFFSQANGRIATKLSQDGLQVSVHPGCAQGQGQRSRDTRTFLDSWMSYSVIDGLVQILYILCVTIFHCYNRNICVNCNYISVVIYSPDLYSPDFYSR